VKVQARITLPADARREIDQLRTIWNPERATGNPAHITVAYQDEAPDPILLAERLQFAASRTPPFRLDIGAATRFPIPVRGAFLTIADPSNAVAAIRAFLLAPPFTQRERFGLHVTLLHPDQGARLETAWPAFAQLQTVDSFVVHEVQLVGPENEVLATFPLQECHRENIE
jgi:2'-5' RNA ligase